MGCGESKEGQDESAGDGTKGPEGTVVQLPAVPPTGPKLLDKYLLGNVLGQGAFGVVYKCTKKGTKEEYAVKMIDQVESPLSEIKKEVTMLQKLDHPTVIKLHDVFYEKVFVCMVLELYSGGDMIQGMMAHWKSKGMIAMGPVRHLTRQMWECIAWIHSKSCVHRDVKGDNFMMDTPDVENPRNKLYLSDFGTVQEIGATERLTQKCGTKNYWSPEFYRMSYGIKVDCWAVGVVMYGLFTGKFPFKSEDDVRHKVLQLPKRVDQEGEELLNQVFERDEAKRWEAKQALTHPWIANIQGARVTPEEFEPGFVPEVKESGANAGVAERRRELVDRLANASGFPGRRGTVTVEGDTFVVKDEMAERSTKYEWFTPAKAADIYESLEKAAKMPDPGKTAEVTSESIEKMLQDHNVSVDGFGVGQAKTFSEFVAEIQSGYTQLLLDATQHKHLVRVVDVVLLRLTVGSASSKKYLVEINERYPDGRARTTNQLPGNKKAPIDNSKQTAEKLCRHLGMVDCDIRWDFSSRESFEQSEASPSYPGVRTVYRKEIISGHVATNDPLVLGRIGAGDGKGFSVEDDRKYTRAYAWLSEGDCLANSVKISVPKERGDISALVHAPVGLDEEELQAFLQKNKVDVSRWGKDTFRSLAEFSEELVKGESTLVQQADGRIVRVVDIVVLKIVRALGGKVLVEVEEAHKAHTTQRKRLPAVKRRSDEHQFLAARRLVTKFLQLDDNKVNIDPNDVRMVEEEQESTSYDGLKTLYRKRFMTATLA